MAGDQDTGKPAGNGDNGSAGELQELQGQLKTLENGKKALEDERNDLKRKLEDADHELLGQDYLDFLDAKKTGKLSKAPPPKEETIDLDTATPAEIAKHFENKYKGDLKKAVEDINEKVDKITDNMGNVAASIDLAITGIKHKELGIALDTPKAKRTEEQNQLVSGLLRIAEENPTWGSAKCYRQAKREMKEAKEDEEAAEKAKAEEGKKAEFEKPGAPSTALTEKGLDKNEAAEKAWRHSFGNRENM